MISILNWNGLNNTLLCLRSLDQSEFRDFDVLVIDNGSKDDPSKQIATLHPDVCVVRNATNNGFASGHNQGIEHAGKNGYEFVWILNNDTVLKPNVLGELVAALDADPGVGMVTPIIVNDDATGSIQFCGCELDPVGGRFVHFALVEQALEAQRQRPALFCIWGTAILARTQLLARIGGFDAKFFAYYEDLDLSVRVSQAGYANRIVPSAQVQHGGANDPDQRPPHYVYFNTRNRLLFWRKHSRGVAWFRRCCQLLAGALIYAGEWHERGQHAKGHAAKLAIVDGMLGRGGPWDATRAAPHAGFRVLLRHPYFFARLLRSRGLGGTPGA